MFYLLYYHRAVLIAVCSSRESAESMRDQYLALARLDENNDYYDEVPVDDLMEIVPVTVDQYFHKYVDCTDIVLPRRCE